MELGIVQSNSAFCWAATPAIPDGGTRLNVHFVLAPFSILAGTGSQVPLTVPVSSISTEELDTMTLALDVMTLAEERFTMGEEELCGGTTDAEDMDAEETEAELGSVISLAELEEGSTTMLPIFAAHLESLLQYFVAESTRDL